MSTYIIQVNDLGNISKGLTVSSSWSLRVFIQFLYEKGYIKIQGFRVNDSIYSVERHGYKTLGELGFCPNVQVILYEFVNGGAMTPSFNFNSCETMVQQQFNNSAPGFRRISEGISFEGTCINPICLAYNRNVLCTLGFGYFDIICYITDERKIPKCPLCGSGLNDCMKFGFYQCNWKVCGKTIEGIKFKKKGTSNKSCYETFEEGENTLWQTLDVTVSGL